MTGGATDRGVRPAAHEQRRPAGLRGRRLDRDVREAVEAPGERRGPVAEQHPQRLDPLVRPCTPLLDGHSGGDEVPRPLAAHPQPEQEPPPGDVVERRSLLRDEARVPERQEHHSRSERDPARDGGEGRERDAEVEDRIVEREMLAGPDRVVPQLLGELGDRPVPARVGELGRELPAPLDPDPHRPDATEQARGLPGLLVVRHEERQVVLHLRAGSVLVRPRRPPRRSARGARGSSGGRRAGARSGRGSSAAPRTRAARRSGAAGCRSTRSASRGSPGCGRTRPGCRAPGDRAGSSRGAARRRPRDVGGRRAARPAPRAAREPR